MENRYGTSQLDSYHTSNRLCAIGYNNIMAPTSWLTVGHSITPNLPLKTNRSKVPKRERTKKMKIGKRAERDTKLLIRLMVMIQAAGFWPAWSGDEEYDGSLRVGLLVSGRGFEVDWPLMVCGYHQHHLHPSRQNA